MCERRYGWGKEIRQKQNQKSVLCQRSNERNTSEEKHKIKHFRAGYYKKWWKRKTLQQNLIQNKRALKKCPFRKKGECYKVFCL
ncbi:hypothetical protein CDB3_28975 [Bacillus sp. CDB3]|nr:hypothetical protein CDB3_28975 [Bacillus sp. CDB3]